MKNFSRLNEYCEHGNVIWTYGLNDGFDMIQEDILDCIHENLFQGAFVVRSNPRRFDGVVNMRTSKIELVTKRIFKKKFPSYDPDFINGAYSLDDGAIYLIDVLACLKTIIHETLHSCSITSQDPLLYRQYKLFFEGLTELYSGFIMSRLYPDLTTECWAINTRLCRMHYVNQVKNWGAFCFFIPLAETCPVYFASSNFTNFRENFGKFIDHIHDRGYNSFKNPFDLDNAPLLSFFMKECERNFGNDWSFIKDSNNQYMEFNKMLLNVP